ncbi:rod shape-determining protein MreC [Succinimonas amylolytica]|uniref:rod shape-determining protein MreC n=1 Tax=Succinimonas amylolytica TaxID=83769 RepID=UPI00036CD047|nr:rod shape-determining protein MreC [Succinimonas amylolytica]
MVDKLSYFGISSTARFIICGIFSLILIVCDSHFNYFRDLRYTLESWLTPVYYVANMPVVFGRGISESRYSYQELLRENNFLKREISDIRVDLLRYDSLVEDNERLRRLSNSPIQDDFRKIGAEVIMVDTNPFSLTVMINRGTDDDVYEGQPVVNEEGIVGLVISVSKSTSRVLLISDQNHAVPVVVLRNGIRAIASGTGVVNELSIINMPRNVDIREGDLLVTSGLGGKFPRGYPVARVSTFDRREGVQFAEIKAQPTVFLDRLRHMFLIWVPESQRDQFYSGVADVGDRNKTDSQNGENNKSGGN